MAGRSAGAVGSEGLRGPRAAEASYAAHPVAIAQLSQGPVRGTMLGEPPFPEVSADGISPVEWEQLVRFTCHKAKAKLARLVLHTGLAADVRAVHASLALAHRVVCCISVHLHNEASIWAEGTWTR